MSKVALVTASSAGLGAAIVKALAPNFRVVINYNSRKSKADEVIASATSIPPAAPPEQPRFHAVQADVFQKSEVQRLVQTTVETMGRLDVVISNHGWTRMTNFMDFSDQTHEEDWDGCFNTNVKSHLWLFEAAKPYLEVSPGGGSFVTIASLAGVRPSGSSLPYSVTKAAQIHLVKGLAVIAGPKVRCNSVSPGLLMTEWGEKFPKEKVEVTKGKAAGKDLATVEDVAETVRLIVNTRSTTGQNFVVDCGIAI